MSWRGRFLHIKGCHEEIDSPFFHMGFVVVLVRFACLIVGFIDKLLPRISYRMGIAYVYLCVFVFINRFGTLRDCTTTV